MAKTLADLYVRFFGTKKHSLLISTIVILLGYIMDILGIIFTINVSIPVGIGYIILTVYDATYLISAVRYILSKQDARGQNKN